MQKKILEKSVVISPDSTYLNTFNVSGYLILASNFIDQKFNVLRNILSIRFLEHKNWDIVEEKYIDGEKSGRLDFNLTVKVA